MMKISKKKISKKNIKIIRMIMNNLVIDLINYLLPLVLKIHNYHWFLKRIFHNLLKIINNKMLILELLEICCFIDLKKY